MRSAALAILCVLPCLACSTVQIEVEPPRNGRVTNTLEETGPLIGGGAG